MPMRCVLVCGIIVCSCSSAALAGSPTPMPAAPPKVPMVLQPVPQPTIPASGCRNAGGQLVPCTMQPAAAPLPHIAPAASIPPGNCRNAGGQPVPCVAVQPGAPLPQSTAPSAKGIVKQITAGPRATGVAAPAQPLYTFSQAPGGGVQVFQNGKLITTSTPQFAAQQYGYQGSVTATPPSGIAVPTIAARQSSSITVGATHNGAPPPPTPQPILAVKPGTPPTSQTTVTKRLVPSTVPVKSSAIAGPTKTASQVQTTSWPNPGAVILPKITTTAAPPTPSSVTPLTSANSAVQGGAIYLSNKANQIEQTPLGQTAVDMGAAAGSELAPKVLNPLSWAADGASVYSAYQKDGGLGAAAQASSVVAVYAAGAAGGPIGAAAAQGAVDYGKYVIAPWLSTAMYNAAPGYFTPK
jgi:hypothetical protein